MRKIFGSAGGFIRTIAPWIVALAVVWMLSNAIEAQCAERGVRLLGLLLQLFGFFTVAMGLRGARRLFGKPSAIERLRLALGRLLGTVRKAPPITATADTTEADDIVTATGRVVVTGDEVREKLVRLETALSELKNRVEQRDVELDSQFGQISTDMNRENTERRAAIKGVTNQLEEAVAGGLQIEWLGLVAFVFGLVLSTASQEITLWAGKDLACTEQLYSWVIHPALVLVP